METWSLDSFPKAVAASPFLMLAASHLKTIVPAGSLFSNPLIIRQHQDYDRFYS
jgi:hypothetical protein